MTMRIAAGAFLCALLLPAGASGGTAGEPPALGAWQNPDIGFVYDMQVDMHDAESNQDGDARWTTRGFRVSTAELSVGADVDPYGRIDFNAFFDEDGAEIHELFFVLPALPMNLKVRGGHFLAAFGRWSQFHTHAMPFASEPRILREYLEGHLAPTGVEVSWLAPISHYVELTGGIYNSMAGHSHDTDPVAEGAAWGPDNPPPGCHFHGDELHCPGNADLADAYYAEVADPEDPTRERTNRGLGDLAYSGRLASSFEMGSSWSIDTGLSAVQQAHYSFSQRFPGRTYSKLTWGADVTVFWNPPEANAYRGMDFGIEVLANREKLETREEDVFVQQDLARSGFFAYVRYRASRRWEYGFFGEKFAPRRGPDDPRRRFGGFLTLNISHFQSLNLEISRYEKTPYTDPIHMLVLQYDGVIGYHTHGRQR